MKQSSFYEPYTNVSSFYFYCFFQQIIMWAEPGKDTKCWVVVVYSTYTISQYEGKSKEKLC